jgi:hypothetical protein
LVVQPLLFTFTGEKKKLVMNCRTRPHITRQRALTSAALLVCAALGAIAGPADGSPSASRPARPASARPAGVVAACPAAGRASVNVPDGIDGIRVFVDAARPGAATDVTVLAGDRDRTLRARGAGEFALLLDEPLRGRRIEVALEPVLEAPSAACVDRVELLRGGAVVGTAQIK